MNDRQNRYHWWAQGKATTTMKDLRDTLIEDKPFRVFHLYCYECGETIIESGEVTGHPIKNETLIVHRLNNHSKETGHDSFGGNVEPHQSVETFDIEITVNQSVPNI